MESQEIDIRLANLDDLDDLMALTDGVEWYYTENYWKMLLAAGQTFGLFVDGKHLAAITTILDYGPNTAFIGVVVVQEKYRGLGFASRVITAAEDSLGRKTTPIGLIASTDGKPVYERRGYQTVGMCQKLILAKTAPRLTSPSLEGYRFEPISMDRSREIKKFDRIAFGADRGHVIDTLLEAAGSNIALYDEGNGELKGFAFSYPRKGMTVIGPVVAKTPIEAGALCQMLAYDHDEAIHLDTLPNQSSFMDELARLGFELEEDAPIMVLPASQNEFSFPDQIFALTSQGFG